MQLLLTIHDSWATSGAALAEILSRVAALERPAPTLSPPPAPMPRTREPGEDDEDLAELVAGMDDAPETIVSQLPVPAAPPKPSPTSKPFDGIPATGNHLYRWACD